jgi:hypothetical protein
MPGDYGMSGVGSTGPGTSGGHIVYRAPTSNGPHDPSLQAHVAHITSNGVVMTPEHIRAMQQFLVNHGFKIAVDGVYGPETQTAAAAYRTHRPGAAPTWNANHGYGVKPGELTPAAQAARVAANAPPTPHDPSPQAHALAPPSAPDPTAALVAALMGQGGNVGQMIDPNYYAAAAAAPDNAAVQSLLQEIALDPKQEAQNQYDISSWYGLNPKDPNYALSVLGRLGQAKAGDAGVASDAASNVSQIASALAGSIGGAANGGAGALAAAGANDAGMMGALGKANTDYADNMNPLLAAEARGQMLKDKAANSQALMDLQAQLAAARGQATADAANARGNAIGTNNSLAQQRFADKGNLLGIMAQMSASGQKSALTAAQIQEMLARAHHYATPTAPKTASVNLNNLQNQVASTLGVGTDHRLPANTNLGGVAHLVGTVLQAAKVPKTDPRYQRLAQTILASFLDSNGNPLQIPAGWFSPNTR